MQRDQNGVQGCTEGARDRAPRRAQNSPSPGRSASCGESPLERHELEIESRLGRLRGLGGDVPQAGSDSMLHGPGQAEDRELEPCPQHGSNAGLTPEGTVFRMGDVELRAFAGRWVDVDCWPLAGIRWHYGDDDLEDWAGECHIEPGPAVGPISRDQAESRAWDRYGARGRVGQLVPGSSPHHYRFRVFRIGAAEPEDLERAGAPDQHLDPAGPQGLVERSEPALGLTTCPECLGELDAEVGCETCLGRGYVDLPHRPRLVPDLPVAGDPRDVLPDEPPLVQGGQGRSVDELVEDAEGAMCLVALAVIGALCFGAGALVMWLVGGAL